MTPNVPPASLFKSNPRVPLIAEVFPKSTAAAPQMTEAFHGLDTHYIFRHLVAELAFDAETQRCTMWHRQHLTVHLIGHDGLRMKRVNEIDTLVIERIQQLVGAMENDVARVGL